VAIIYGRAAAEIDLLSIAPKSVQKIEDVETIHEELKEKLNKTKKDFFEKVPDKIVEEENILEKLKSDEKATNQKFDEKIKILEDKKGQGGFSIISSSIKISFVKNFSKRREINKIKNLEKKQQNQLSEWKDNPEQIFNREQKDQINEVRTFATLEKSNEIRGAKGEVRALQKLSELSDDYHILCGIRVELPRYVRYNGRKNLRTAQLDFVVISKRGIILVEVKNWSDKFYHETNKIRPHEQVDRAAKVLWIVIKSRWGWLATQTPRVTSVLLSIQGNMRYDPKYKFVNVSDLNRINYFIENRKEVLSNKDVEKLLDMLKDHVTK